MFDMKLKAAPEIVRSEIYNDEELVWWGQPVASRLAQQVDIFSIIVSAVMAVFAVGFYLFAQDMFAQSSRSTFGAFGSSNRGFPAIFPIMFTLIPGIMFLGAMWNALMPLRKWVKARKTYYVLTNKRALIIEQVFSKNVQSFYDEHIQKMQTRTYANGVGDIIFATEMVTRQYRRSNQGGLQINFSNDGVNFGSGTRTSTYQIQHGFMAVPDARTVEDLVSQIFFAET